MDIEKPTCSKRKPIERYRKNKYKIVENRSFIYGSRKNTRSVGVEIIKTVSQKLTKLKTT
ncbi:hypothetical protein CVS40_4684 [Lucilia cuprina]|nr:hypothetical protein CVS40_4684 [Lucilia cuprina]